MIDATTLMLIVLVLGVSNVVTMLVTAWIIHCFRPAVISPLPSLYGDNIEVHGGETLDESAPALDALGGDLRPRA